jgi:hypothetical protein
MITSNENPSEIKCDEKCPVCFSHYFEARDKAEEEQEMTSPNKTVTAARTVEQETQQAGAAGWNERDALSQQNVEYRVQNMRLRSEKKALLEACKETLRQLNSEDCPSIPDGAMVRGRLVNAITKAEKDQGNSGQATAALDAAGGPLPNPFYDPEADDSFTAWYTLHGIPLGIGRENALVIYEAAVSEHRQAVIDAMSLYNEAKAEGSAQS